MKRLISIEERINQIAKEDMGLDFVDVQFDIVPEQKMFEVMAYGLPGQFSNWKFGRDYEKIRTIYEKTGGSLPLEVVFTTDPARSFLMKNNTFAIQALTIAHVIGHVAFSTMNKYHCMMNKDIISRLNSASNRFDDYERLYGINTVEKVVDAGHSIMRHSSPWETEETENEKRERVFKKKKQKIHERKTTQFGDFFTEDVDKKIKMERELYNSKLWNWLKNITPVEPTEDLLRYIIDNSTVLSDWEKDILEIIRLQGRYQWPMIRTKYMNEGWATFVHQKIMRKLFQENLLTPEEHSEYNYMNAGVKAMNPFSLNPYMIGCGIWEDIEDRWNKGKYSEEYEEETDMKRKIEWDTGEMKGWEKCLSILKVHNDWFFMSNYLTNEVIRNLKIYLYQRKEDWDAEYIVITEHEIDEIRKIIINNFSSNSIPVIKVVNGNYKETGALHLIHENIGMELDPAYARRTLRHIHHIWGKDIVLHSVRKGKTVAKYTQTKHTKPE